MILNDKQIRRYINITNGVLDKVQKGNTINGRQVTSSYGIDPQGYTFRLKTPEGWDEKEIIVKGYNSVQLDSHETFTLPNNVCAFMYGKSSFTRRGLIFSFAVVDAGYSGRIGFSAFNPTPHNIALPLGQGIAQIVFHQIDEPDKAYEGAWQGYDSLDETEGLGQK